MDHERFDDLTKVIATRSPRRAALRALAAVAATPLALLGAAETAGKGKKKSPKRKNKGKKNKPPPPPPKECPGGCVSCQTCVDGACVDLFPPCAAELCQEPGCNPVTWEWTCFDKEKPSCDPVKCEAVACNPVTGEFECAVVACPDDEVCCNDVCMPPCVNGCEHTGADCFCSKPPDGKHFCPSWLRCVDFATDKEHCGGCGNACAWCGDQCPEYRANWACCDGVCIYTERDRFNCGGCGVQCGFEENCSRGKCVPACPVGETLCGRNLHQSSDPVGQAICTSPTHPYCEKNCLGHWDTCYSTNYPCLAECAEYGNCGCGIPDECRAPCGHRW